MLFLYGVAASGESGFGGLLLGGLLGLALGGALSALMSYELVKIPPRHLFAVTTTLITFLAAGMAAQCVVFLQQAGLSTALSNSVWNTSSVLPDDSLFRRLVHVLFGYVDQPSGMQVLVYLCVLVGIYFATWIASRPNHTQSLDFRHGASGRATLS